MGLDCVGVYGSEPLLVSESVRGAGQLFEFTSVGGTEEHVAFTLCFCRKLLCFCKRSRAAH